MRKSFHASRRLAIGALAALALVFGGVAAPALADEEPIETPAAEVVEAPVAESPAAEPSAEEEASEAADETALDEEVAPAVEVAPAEDPAVDDAADAPETPLASSARGGDLAPLSTIDAGITVSQPGPILGEGTVTVAGSYPATFDDGNGSQATALYVMYCVDPDGGRATGAQCESGNQQLVSSAPLFGGSVPATGTVVDGVWSFSVEVPVTDAFGDHECAAAGDESCGVFVRLFHMFTGPDATAFDQFAPVEFAGEPGTGGPGPGGPGTGGPGTGGPGTGGPGTEPGTSGPSVSLSPSAINPTVANTVTVSGSGFTGAGAANGVYVSLGSASIWQPGQVPSEGGWVTTVWVTPAQLSGGAFTTTLSVPAGALSLGTEYGVATFAAHGLALTNRSLDTWTPLSLSTSAPATVTAAALTTREPAPTPPSSSGASVDRPRYAAGGQVTITATGFRPNETGILVVLYSDPVVLDRNAKADGNGVVTWTGYLPRGVTGSHTLTLQGSISVGSPVSITASPAAAGQCLVDDATLTWGFKESFRAYITSTIANGEWATSDGATYETPEFGWNGAGTYDPETETGDLGFTGAVRFTGHDGALDTTIANPRIVIDEDRAVLLLDISGTTQEGATVEAQGVEFAELDLAGATTEAAMDAGSGEIETIALGGIPATLTAAGAEAFGTYPEGEPLDPVSLSLELPADCAAAAPDETPGPEATTTDEITAAAPGPDLSWIWWLVGGIVLLAVIVAIVVAVARRRGATD